jgi:hypothetical protein
LGWLDWEPGKARTLRLTQAGSAVVRGSNGVDLPSWLLRLEGFVAELDALALQVEVSVKVAGSMVACFETKGGSLAEEEG